jgi:UDP-N-acetylmuramoylalanine--D-glutamate ligase
MIGVIGMARSGLAAALLAKRNGADVFVSDAGYADQLSEATAALNAAGISYETGGHSDQVLACDYLILSPGVPTTVGIVHKATERGIPYFSELEFSSWFAKGRLVAVTGSNGKTTTTTLIGEILREAGIDTHVCGNIGRPLADVVELLTDDSVTVVEVSSFQLETIAEFHPHVAMILNLSADHLDRHGNMENYKQTKYRITENQGSDDYFVVNRDDTILVSDNPSTTAQRLFFSTGTRNGVASFVENETLFYGSGDDLRPVIGVSEIGIPGPHNLQNASAATVAVGVLGVKHDVIARVLKSFAGVEHRLETVSRVAGVRFINDSKATNVDSVCWALRSMQEPVYLILGGRHKGAPYTPIIDVGRERIKGLLVLGEAKDKIFADLGKTFPTEFVDTLQDAIRKGFELAVPGETVLLSPGCASFDMFENFEQRGMAFKAAVGSLKNNRNSNEKVSS